METVDEINSPFALAGPTALARATAFWIRFGPAFTVIGIVFWRIKVSVHAASGAKLKHGFAVRHAPGRAKKSFNDATALELFDFHDSPIWHIAEKQARFSCQ
jgi:hypothetical protein